MAPGASVGASGPSEPDRWLHIHQTGSRAGWEDMAAFAQRQQNDLRTRMQHAIEGKGTFRHFRDLVHDEDLTET